MEAFYRILMPVTGTGAGSHTIPPPDRPPFSALGVPSMYLSKPVFSAYGSQRSYLASRSNPITDATDPQLACNDDGSAGALQLTATVAAGSAITAYWNQVWPHPYGPMVSILKLSIRETLNKPLIVDVFGFLRIWQL